MIEANFEGQEMSLQYDGVISDSIRFLKIHFNFDEYWDGFEKTAVFAHNGEKFLVALSDGNSIYLGDNTCYVPQEVIKAQSFSVSVFGNKGNTVITSSNEDVSVADSGMGKRIPRDPTPTAWSQMLEIENHTNSMVNELIERADSGEFNGVGVPEGGTIGQVLKKSSNADYDTEWGEISDAYTKEQSDNRYVAKTTTVNGKQLSGNIVINYSDVGAYSKPSGGIPKTDLSSGIQSSLDKADTALQSHQDISGKANKTYVDTELEKKQNNTDNNLNTNAKTVVGAINELNSIKGTYSKPQNGIPKTDLSSDIITSLDKADTALQSHQDISGKADKTYVDTELVTKANVNDLSSVATSGSYNDLTNKPTTELIKKVVCSGEENAVNINTDENDDAFSLDGLLIRIISPTVTRTQDILTVSIKADSLICRATATLSYDGNYSKFIDITMFKQYGMFIACDTRSVPGNYTNTASIVSQTRYTVVKLEDAKKSIKEITISVSGKTFAADTTIYIYGVRANENQ